MRLQVLKVISLVKAAKGELVTLVEQTNGEWWLVRTKDGEQGYAYSRYYKHKSL